MAVRAWATVFGMVSFVALRSNADEPHQIDDPGAKNRDIDDNENAQGDPKLECAMRGYSIAGPEQSVHSPWLTPDLGRKPAGKNSHYA